MGALSAEAEMHLAVVKGSDVTVGFLQQTRARFVSTPKFEEAKPAGLMKPAKASRRPAELFRWLVLAAVEPVKIGPPDFARFRRRLAEIGEGNHHFDLPEFIDVRGIRRGAFQLNRILHLFRRVTPIALELLRNTALIEIIRDDGIKDASQRVPLQLEIAGKILGGDEKLCHFLLPEAAVPRGERRLHVGVSARPAEIKGRVIIPHANG